MKQTMQKLWQSNGVARCHKSLLWAHTHNDRRLRQRCPRVTILSSIDGIVSNLLLSGFVFEPLFVALHIEIAKHLPHLYIMIQFHV